MKPTSLRGPQDSQAAHPLCPARVLLLRRVNRPRTQLPRKACTRTLVQNVEKGLDPDRARYTNWVIATGRAAQEHPRGKTLPCFSRKRCREWTPLSGSRTKGSKRANELQERASAQVGRTGKPPYDTPFTHRRRGLARTLGSGLLRSNRAGCSERVLVRVVSGLALLTRCPRFHEEFSLSAPLLPRELSVTPGGRGFPRDSFAWRPPLNRSDISRGEVVELCLGWACRHRCVRRRR